MVRKYLYLKFYNVLTKQYTFFVVVLTSDLLIYNDENTSISNKDPSWIIKVKLNIFQVKVLYCIKVMLCLTYIFQL